MMLMSETPDWKSDEKLVTERYWILKAGQLDWSDILALNMDDTNKYLVIFLKRVPQWSLWVWVPIGTMCSRSKSHLLSKWCKWWSERYVWEIFPGRRKYLRLRLRLRSMPGCLRSHQIPIQTFTPSAMLPRLHFSLIFLGRGGVPVEKKQCTNVEMNTKRKQNKLPTYLLYSAAPTLLSIPLSNCQLLPSRGILATSSVLVLSFIQLS